MNKELTYIIEPTAYWGDTWGTYPKSHLHRMKRLHEVFQYPFKDHAEAFSYRPKDSRGRPKHSQCFIVSYAYKNSVDYSLQTEKTLIQTLEELNFGYHKTPVVFRGLDAYRIIVFDTDVVVDHAIELLNESSSSFVPS